MGTANGRNDWGREARFSGRDGRCWQEDPMARQLTSEIEVIVIACLEVVQLVS